MYTAPAITPLTPQLINYYIIPSRTDIMGHQAIIGLDAIKKFDIRLIKNDNRMCAYSGNYKIGEETPKDLSICYLYTENHNSAPTNLNKTELKLKRLLMIYSDVFAETVSSFIRTDPMTIELKQEFLVKTRLRTHSLEDIAEIHKQVQRLLENDIIERSASPYSCNCHLVPKKTGQKRLVINFIPLNEIAVKDHYPMPHIQDLFNSLRDSRYFCTLDCTEGFFQIPILERHRERTAFITPHGMFQFKRCPFGFTNSPAKFQRTMNYIFEDGLYERCVIYVDDILVIGRTREQLLENLTWVLERCVQYNVKIKQSKCKFFVQKVEFLGHLISYNSVAPVPGKIDPILAIKPENKTQVLAILGTFNYYSKFIPDYTEKTKPLRDLIKKDKVFEWLPIHETAIEELRLSLTKATAHEIPETYSTKLIDINVNHSSIEVTCTSEQGALISRAGSILSTSESNYTPVEKTLMGIVLVYNKFGSYLRGRVIIRTPLKALVTALQMRERSDRINRLLLQLPPEANYEIQLVSRTKEIQTLTQNECPPDEIFYTDGACTGNGKPHGKASWAILALMNSSLSKVGLVEGNKFTNQIAELTAIKKACETALKNGLSNIVIVTDSKYASDSMNKWLDVWSSNGWKDNKNKPIVNMLLLQELADLKKRLNIRCIHVKGHSNDEYNNLVDRMARDKLEETFIVCGLISAPLEIDQTIDEEIKSIITNLDSNPEYRERFVYINQKLYYVDPKLPAILRNRLVVPRVYRERLMRIAHDDPIYGGHLGIKKTFNKLRKYYWRHMRADIEQHIATCDVCQRFKVPKGPKPGLLQPIPVSKIFERLHLDIIGPLCKTSDNNSYIITAIDAFSRYGYARARTDVKTIDIINFLQEEVVSRHGLPEQITTDNGSQFKSTAFGVYIEKLGVKHTLTSVYHPQSNGMDERFNGSLKKIIRNYVSVNQKDWDKKLIWALTLYNMTLNESTGLSPYTILYGVEPRTPLNTTSPLIELSELTVDHQAIRDIAKRNAEYAHTVQKYYYDRNHKAQDFKVMDLVLLRARAIKEGTSKKLAFLWVGPYIITQMIRHPDSNEPQAALLLDLSRMTKEQKPAAFADLKPYAKRPNEYEDIEDLEIAANQPQPEPSPGEVITQIQHHLDEPSHTHHTNRQQSAVIPIHSFIPLNLSSQRRGVRLTDSAISLTNQSNTQTTNTQTNCPPVQCTSSCPTAQNITSCPTAQNITSCPTAQNTISCPTAIIDSQQSLPKDTQILSDLNNNSLRHSQSLTSRNDLLTTNMQSLQPPTSDTQSHAPVQSLTPTPFLLSEPTTFSELCEGAQLSQEAMDLETIRPDQRGSLDCATSETPPNVASLSSPSHAEAEMIGIAQASNSTNFLSSTQVHQAQLVSTPPIPPTQTVSQEQCTQQVEESTIESTTEAAAQVTTRPRVFFGTRPIADRPGCRRTPLIRPREARILHPQLAEIYGSRVTESHL